MDLFRAAQWAEGLVATDVTIKQAKGRAWAERLGFTPGGAGADGGVDGYAGAGATRAIFFCRLSSTPLSVKDAREFAAVLLKEGARLGVCVAGQGYAPGFAAELNSVLKGGRRRVALHLLTAVDVYAETTAWAAACAAVARVSGPSG